MKTAANWFAELQDPPEEGLVDQPMRVITTGQIAAIQRDAQEEPVAFITALAFDGRYDKAALQRAAKEFLAKLPPLTVTAAATTPMEFRIPPKP